MAGLFMKEIRKYDPVADGVGGFTHAHGTTVPGGHYKEIKDIQKGIKNRLGRFVRDCLNDNDGGGGGNGGTPLYPKWADQIANVRIPPPVYPGSTIETKQVVLNLPVMPDEETIVVELKTYHKKQQVKQVATGVAVAGGTAAVCYITYRVVRMLPSLLPPLWWTIPANAVAP